MNLPKIVSALVSAQNNFDSLAYAQCFNESAVVFDEGKTHKGKTEIQNWIEKSNLEYRALMKPLDYKETGAEAVLRAEVAGTFPGSPAVLQFHLSLKDGLIESLNISG